MGNLNFKKEIDGEIEEVVLKITALLKDQGFGILTRIDFDAKIKEKLGKDILPTVILGACNPALAYQAFLANPDVTSLLPCNAVVRKLASGKISVELAKPSTMMQALGDGELACLALKADEGLNEALQKLS